MLSGEGVPAPAALAAVTVNRYVDVELSRGTVTLRALAAAIVVATSVVPR